MKQSSQHQHDDTLLADEPTLEISSLIDVCFLLLIYFLVTTTIQPREQDLNMRLPVPYEVTPISLTPMLIELRQGGEVVVNPGEAAELYERDVKSRSLPELYSRLRMLAGMGPSSAPKVLLRVHDDVGQQRYIDVINCLAGAGVQDIALQD